MNQTTLEQSKKMKAWGAPQDIGRGHEKIRGEFYAAYILEELIEWLGDDFLGLNLLRLRQGDLKWCARGVRVDISSKGRPQYYPVEYGKTPLEAVYNLCFAIYGEKDD